MSLKVLVEKAANLKNVELVGKSDPYTKVEFKGETQKTKHIDDELNPTWNETLIFDLKGTPLSGSDEITFSVRDYDKVGTGKFMGQAKVQLGGMISGAKEMKKTLSLTDKKDNPVEGKQPRNLKIFGYDLKASCVLGKIIGVILGGVAMAFEK